MGSNNYLNSDWWQRWLDKRFPDFCGTPDPSWNLRGNSYARTFFGRQSPWNYLWYRSEVAVLGYQHKPYSRPLFWVYFPETGEDIVRFFNMEEPEEDLQSFEAIADPMLLPLCLGTWAEPVMVKYFQKIQQQIV